MRRPLTRSTGIPDAPARTKRLPERPRQPLLDSCFATDSYEFGQPRVHYIESHGIKRVNWMRHKYPEQYLEQCEACWLDLSPTLARFQQRFARLHVQVPENRGGAKECKSRFPDKNSK